ncbi:hypothetical protein C1H46_024172 [Malus baccata]|uniref:Uncharacterized protein n=1 Tax=Malus baccata TaxID=106549 RepID=A0A540LUS9_MALBA|nr:hypothetical protein C1H46_024172 [Malus baccata]
MKSRTSFTDPVPRFDSNHRYRKAPATQARKASAPSLNFVLATEIGQPGASEAEDGELRGAEPGSSGSGGVGLRAAMVSGHAQGGKGGR